MADNETKSDDISVDSEGEDFANETGYLETELIFACRNGKRDVARSLISKGAKVSCADEHHCIGVLLMGMQM